MFFHIFFYNVNINKNRYIEQKNIFLCNQLIYKKVVYVLIFSFYGENEKGKEKMKNRKIILILPGRDSNPRYLNKTFAPII